jgi:hypothetical protein
MTNIIILTLQKPSMEETITLDKPTTNSKPHREEAGETLTTKNKLENTQEEKGDEEGDDINEEPIEIPDAAGYAVMSQEEREEMMREKSVVTSSISNHANTV